MMVPERFTFRKAAKRDAPAIWDILLQAIEKRRKEGSLQWQDGYPNPQTVEADLEKGVGYVLENEGIVMAYCAIILNDEPAYQALEGEWLTNGDFFVVHRVALAGPYLGKGLATKIFDEIEEMARQQNISSIRADTNFDNPAMLRLFEKLGYQYCGEVYFRGTPRMAYEKVLP